MDAVMRWLGDAWMGYRVMLGAGALDVPGIILGAFAAGAVLGWVARWDWVRSCDAEDLEEWLAEWEEDKTNEHVS
ncbi:MAG: hypothetical protein RR337_10365 [Clostridia bacterium]